MSAASQKAVTDALLAHGDAEIERLRLRAATLEAALRIIVTTEDDPRAYAQSVLDKLD